MDNSNNIIDSNDIQIPENFLLSPITPIVNTNPQNRDTRINKLINYLTLLI